MILMKWDEAKYGTGFKEIDFQHKRLFDGIKELLGVCATLNPNQTSSCDCEALLTPSGVCKGSSSEEAKASALQMIRFLGSYVIVHFKYEEELMDRYNCHKKELNKQEHEKFLRRFAELKSRFETEDLTPPMIIRLESFLCIWLTQHILKIDIALREFSSMEQKPIEPVVTPQKPEYFWNRLWKILSQ